MSIDCFKRASVTSNLALGGELALGAQIPAVAGTVVALRLRQDMPHELELATGRMAAAFAGDVVVGALGNRRALRGVAGELPATVEPGDTLHMLNRGGVIGLSEGSGAAAGTVLGAVLVEGLPASIGAGALAPLRALPPLPPVVAIAGSCMHAGKTAAACALVRGLSRAGYRVGAVKLAGVAAQRDVLAMKDCGAELVRTFVDGGLSSTCGHGDVVGVARACLADVAAAGVDVIVAELGDGLLGDYGVGTILAADDVRGAISACVLSAVDPVAAWGGVTLLRQHGLHTAAVTGATTDNVAGEDAVLRHTGVPAANARREPGRLTHLVLDALNQQAAPAAKVVSPTIASRKPAPSLRVAALAAVVLGGA